MSHNYPGQGDQQDGSYDQNSYISYYNSQYNETLADCENQAEASFGWYTNDAARRTPQATIAYHGGYAAAETYQPPAETYQPPALTTPSQTRGRHRTTSKGKHHSSFAASPPGLSRREVTDTYMSGARGSQNHPDDPTDASEALQGDDMVHSEPEPESRESDKHDKKGKKKEKKSKNKGEGSGRSHGKRSKGKGKADAKTPNEMLPREGESHEDYMERIKYAESDSDWFNRHQAAVRRRIENDAYHNQQAQGQILTEAGIDHQDHEPYYQQGGAGYQNYQGYYQ
ncbi:hypothetical protein B0T16DRAFT_384120 [Cercophora newfieldiana]|uniref:Uncharacterized protein n=1 Tax=Cercophora newfieldiana TaxID=92897 RepID=A0AA39YP33_9PEZI|nr:hypothetical protein B0T16DRAFT_384120 [Cercophora newfieldiana]